MPKLYHIENSKICRANCVYKDEAARFEQSHLDLYCLNIQLFLFLVFEGLNLTSLALLAGGTDSLGSGVQGLDSNFTDGPDLVWARKNEAECGLGASGSRWKQMWY